MKRRRKCQHGQLVSNKTGIVDAKGYLHFTNGMQKDPPLWRRCSVIIMFSTSLLNFERVSFFQIQLIMILTIDAIKFQITEGRERIHAMVHALAPSLS